MPTQADIDLLEQALIDRKGARSITFSDQSVTFESLKDMSEYLAVLRRQIAGGSTTRYAATSKGV